MTVRSATAVRPRRAPTVAPDADRLVVVARGAGTAARAAAECLGPSVRVLAADAPDLAARLAHATEVRVLDPGRVRAWRNRRRSGGAAATALTVPMAGADRLALLRRLRGHAGTVRWITRPEDLPSAGPRQ